jgi:repressor LexA
MPQPLTKRQRQLLDYVHQYSTKNGYPPTHEEMAEALEVNSVATIHDHLLELVRKGFVKIYKGSVRGVEVVEKSFGGKTGQVELPLIGLIAAGKPIEAIEGRQTTVKVAPNLLSGNRRAFVLKVKGDSMIEEGILDGDYVVVEEQNTAENGDIVVALLENEFATLKKFYREKGRIRLMPANAKMAPIYAQNVTIQGKVKSIIRRYS